MSGDDGRNIDCGTVRKTRSKQSLLLPLFPLVIAFIPAVCAQTNQPPTPLPTLDQSIFRSRWVGPQYDQPTPTPSPTPPPVAAETPTVEPVPTPEPPPAPQGWDASLGDGFYLGAINITPMLTVGWEYSDENNSGFDDGGSNNSFFIAPGLALKYEREVGAWSVAANYAAAYVYYLDDDFNGNGGDGNSDLIQQTLSLSATVQGSRYSITGAVSGSTGTGFDTESGQNNNQINYSAGLTGLYQLSERFSLDGGIHYSQQSQSSANTAPDSDLYDIHADAALNHSWTGKTAFRYEIALGREAQSVQDDPNASRQYIQALIGVTHTPNEKVSFFLAAGARYVEEPQGIVSRDEGFLPAYDASVSYRPSDKTSLTLSSSLEGTDVKPDYHLSALWLPRLTTSLQLSLYQTQDYSGTFSSQILITRGVSASVTQTFLTTVTCTLLGGYEQQDYDKTSDEFDNSAQPSDYFFGSLQIRWQIRHWLSLQTYLTLREQTDDGGEGDDTGLQNTASVALTAVF